MGTCMGIGQTRQTCPMDINAVDIWAGMQFSWMRDSRGFRKVRCARTGVAGGRGFAALESPELSPDLSPDHRLSHCLPCAISCHHARLTAGSR